MTSEQVKHALALVDAFDNGGAWRKRVARRLRRILRDSPQDFYAAYFEAIHQPDPLLAALWRAGRITPETTLDEANRIYLGALPDSTEGVHEQ
jgi:hypothetical protein